MVGARGKAPGRIVGTRPSANRRHELGKGSNKTVMDSADPLATMILRKHARAYEALVAYVLRLEARGDDEVTLRWLGLAAKIAWTSHPGRFTDERLEAIALRAGQRLRPVDAQSAARVGEAIAKVGGQRRVLHVATTIYEVGGHTRLIGNWITQDEGAEHSLVLIDQGQHRIRQDLADRIAASGGTLTLLPDDRSILAKARRLREAARAGYDCVILHHHPNDVVPLVALATADCPPVAVMNHADHVFWLGVTVADAVIDFRAFGARISRTRRGARQGLMFPLPLDPRRPALDRPEARARLGIPADEVMLLTIGSSYKYKPTRKHDFFRTLRLVLAANPAARLYVIGVGPEDLRAWGSPGHDRVKPLGLVSDPSVHEAAADLYLEGFPLNSYTALLETAAHGVCPVLMYAPTPQLDLADDAALTGLVASTSDEPAYVALVSALIADPAGRTSTGQAVAGRIAAIHGGDIGHAYLRPIYERLAAMTHRPALPPTQTNAEGEEDLDLAAFNSSRGGRALLARGGVDALDGLTSIDTLRLLAMSVRIGDTRPMLSDIRAWLGVFRRKLVPIRRGLANQR